MIDSKDLKIGIKLLMDMNLEELINGNADLLKSSRRWKNKINAIDAINASLDTLKKEHPEKTIEGLAEFYDHLSEKLSLGKIASTDFGAVSKFDAYMSLRKLKMHSNNQLISDTDDFYIDSLKDMLQSKGSYDARFGLASEAIDTVNKRIKDLRTSDSGKADALAAKLAETVHSFTGHNLYLRKKMKDNKKLFYMIDTLENKSVEYLGNRNEFLENAVKGAYDSKAGRLTSRAKDAIIDRIGIFYQNPDDYLNENGLFKRFYAPKKQRKHVQAEISEVVESKVVHKETSIDAVAQTQGYHDMFALEGQVQKELLAYSKDPDSVMVDRLNGAIKSRNQKIDDEPSIYQSMVSVVKYVANKLGSLFSRKKPIAQFEFHVYGDDDTVELKRVTQYELDSARQISIK